MNVKQKVCEICGAEGNFDSFVLINFGDGVNADIEVCENCAEKIQDMILPYLYRCPICGETVRSGKSIDMSCVCSGAPVPLALVDAPKNVHVTWRVYATAEIFISRLLENEGYYLDDVIGGYVIRDLSTDKIVTESDGHPMDLDNVIRWVDSHFPYIDE